MVLQQMTKKAKMLAKSIGTHSGTFHADESLACFMLLNTEEFKESEIIRTRDPEVLNNCDIVVDVGGVYDPSTNRYDHHQKEFQETMTIGDVKFETRLSSAGLIYRHFGRQVIANICGWDIQKKSQDIELLYMKLYKNFVEQFDGNDNGVSRYPPDIKPKYQSNTSISDRVARLNPWWNQPVDDIDQRFMKAVEMTGSEFTDRVRYMAFAWMPAREIVKKALDTRKTISNDGRILLFDQALPWKEHLFDLEESLEIEEKEKPLYVVFNANDSWRVQAVPLPLTKFENRLSLPEKWRGLRDAELIKVSAIEECVFVHATGFIGGNRTKEGALQMAKASIIQQLQS